MLALCSKQNGPLWEAFKETNTDRISASELAAVFHLSSSKSRRRLYEEKIGTKKKSTWQGWQMKRGLDEEEPALEYLRYKLKVAYDRPGILYHPIYPISASPDAIFHDGYGVEVKTLASRPIPTCVADLYPEHVLQCMANAVCADAGKWFLFYWNPDKPSKSVLFVVDCSAESFKIFWKYDVMKAVTLFMDAVTLREDNEGLQKKNRKRKWNYDEFFIKQLLIFCELY